MKVAPGLRFIAFLVLGLVTVSPRADAQSFLGLSFTAVASSTNMGISNSLTYTISLTNVTGSAAFFTNTLSGPFQLVSASPDTSVAGVTYYFTNSTSATIGIDPNFYISGSVAQLTVTVQSTGAGFITNAITVGAVAFTNVLATNLVTQVTNTVLPSADLAVSITGPAQSVITNDYVSLGVNVTNFGPNSAPGVVLTNFLPPGVRLINVVPSSPPPTLSGTNVILNLGTLSAGAFESFYLRIQPTNAGTLPFSATINSASVTDTNTANNTSVTNVFVGGYLSGVLVADNVSPTQVFDPQNGLMEQTVQLTNAGSTSTASSRVVVTGLTKTNWLFNASGTNNGNPFVTYAGTLVPGQTVNLRMQYQVPSGRPFSMSNTQLQSYEVPLANLAPPVPAGTPIVVSRIVPLVTGHMLIEFPSILGQSYTVVYYDNGDFSRPLVAPPSITAPADKVQWIDYGPPTTVSDPTNTTSRFYRVFSSP